MWSRLSAVIGIAVAGAMAATSAVAQTTAIASVEAPASASGPAIATVVPYETALRSSVTTDAATPTRPVGAAARQPKVVAAASASPKPRVERQVHAREERSAPRSFSYHVGGRDVGRFLPPVF